MLFQGLALASVALLQYASAQSTTATSSAAASSYTVDPNTVPLATRQSWCNSQLGQCLQLCPGRQTQTNSCDSETLDYECTCMGNIQTNVSDYAGTIPSFECTQWQNTCAQNTTDAQVQQDTCYAVKCGSKDTAALQSSFSASAAMASTSSSSHTGSATGSATETAASATSTRNAAVAVSVGQNYGLAGSILAFVAAFGFAL